MAKGGARRGAGRPKGSINTPRFEDYVTEAEREKFAKFMMGRYELDMNAAKWVGDHLFQKPPQTLAGDPDNPITVAITGMKIIKEAL